jgi:hypothetical protein
MIIVTQGRIRQFGKDPGVVEKMELSHSAELFYKATGGLSEGAV